MFVLQRVRSASCATDHPQPLVVQVIAQAPVTVVLVEVATAIFAPMISS
jgi:hypothetical protein